MASFENLGCFFSLSALKKTNQNQLPKNCYLTNTLWTSSVINWNIISAINYFNGSLNLIPDSKHFFFYIHPVYSVISCLEAIVSVTFNQLHVGASRATKANSLQANISISFDPKMHSVGLVPRLPRTSGPKTFWINSTGWVQQHCTRSTTTNKLVGTWSTVVLPVRFRKYDTVRVCKKRTKWFHLQSLNESQHNKILYCLIRGRKQQTRKIESRLKW